MSLSDYHATTGNWREQLRRNERKTRWVIATFLVVYVVVGLIADTLILQSYYPNATISQCLHALLTFRATPYATLLMGGIAAISLLMTYSLYDRLMLLGTDSREITPETAKTLQEKQLFNVVEEMKVAAGLQYMPKVYLIEANYMNAFASGYSEKSAMVAITRGLLEKLDRAELQAVMAHELSHIRHHDIKLTLMVAILSNLLLIVIDVLFYAVIFRRDRRQDNRLYTVIILLRYLLPLITVVLALFLSRTREYMADAGSVELMRDNEPMARALLKISQDHQNHAEEYAVEYGNTAHEQVRQASYLFDPSSIDPVKSLSSAFSTHPSISDRLKALGFKLKQP
ncbi:zinc metalloprotease HtpX [Legionella oakridgensis]|uniref:Zn-dependent protease with chaperone function n=2 Tax=Legionella oakridgensis TaxID=29423 RepID=W0B672_9GAMM|nr:zinc metalloprotease HtpX [Legionella oakridgensis]AHE66028.1 Zn-dependent protease with chaperone function [Legionella oakridgensis ATCC 33761 = DSM 21215]ETO94258.1 Zn-dependent protease with chaperone function [Legionella oakridgensis RV-2-2007]KTD43565.1 heat shock protein HtpX [Legionella oakridgensis]STY15952.1 Zn-dependent protease with chaperone function [Legionella longbeachae]